MGVFGISSVEKLLGAFLPWRLFQFLSEIQQIGCEVSVILGPRANMWAFRKESSIPQPNVNSCCDMPVIWLSGPSPKRVRLAFLLTGSITRRSWQEIHQIWQLSIVMSRTIQNNHPTWAPLCPRYSLAGHCAKDSPLQSMFLPWGKWH